MNTRDEADRPEDASEGELQEPRAGEEQPVTSSLARYGSWPWVLFFLALAVVPGTVLALSAVAAVSGGDVQNATENPLAIFTAIVVEDLFMVGVVYLLLIRSRVTSWRDMGLTGERSPGFLLKGLGWGLAFLVLSGIVSSILQALGVEQDQAELFPLREAGPWGRAAIWTGGVVLAPLAEEIFFRGYLFRAVAFRKGVVRGLLYSSLLFGLIHLNLAAFLPIVVGSAVLALAYRRSGDLWVPIVAHAVNNAVAFTFLLLG